jgi:hypothetical protein
MFEGELPEAVGLLEALGRRLREIERSARDTPARFYDQQYQLPYDQTAIAFLIRTVRIGLLVVSAGNAIRDDLRLQAEAYDLAAADYDPRTRSI